MTDPITSIGVADISGYLRLAGWSIVEEGPLAQIWSRTQDNEREILVPKKESANDFDKRLRILINDLSKYEQRGSDTIRNEMSFVYYDVVDVEASHPDEIKGTIPLQAGSQLFRAARRLVEASAGATIRRKGYFGSSMPPRAKEYARHVRAGHTKDGSYVLPIISKAHVAPEIPIDHERPYLVPGEEEVLFDRRVTATMATALETLEALAVRADRQPSRSDVMDAVGEGISREMCKSIESVISLREVAEMGLGFTWAPAVATPRNAIKQVTFPRESTPIVQYIGDQLKTVPREQEHVLYGVITDLHHDADENVQGGEIGMETIIKGRKRTVWFEVDEARYQEARRVHTQQRVMVQGILGVGKKQRLTLRVTHFEPDPSLTPS